ncbi:MAG: NADP-dependent malic enzyme [Oscillospiraceae bacterium]|nr:NADP-dependent malic enzyme [Oscillospiraceae bacterium]
MDYSALSLAAHERWGGKLSTVPKMAIDSKDALSIAYTPGVAAPCLAIAGDYDKSFTLTQRRNTIAVVTDGTAVLGLGDIGPEAAMPVMEGKCALFKAFGGVDAVPLCLRTKDVDAIVETVALLAGSFGGINLEDISAPRCFEIERRLQERLDIPVFHDDQHGTAVVVLAALTNALKVLERDISDVRAVISGSGAAGTAIALLLKSRGLTNITMVSSRGIIHRDEPWLNPATRELAEWTNPAGLHGGLDTAVKGANLFIGVSAPGILSADMVRSMSGEPVIFAMANPTPEIMPDVALSAGAAIVGTGRSDFPNQINNVLAFPGIFKGALSVRAKRITEAMKLAAADAIADLAGDKPSRDKLLPEAFDPRLGDAVARAVALAAL